MNGVRTRVCSDSLRNNIRVLQSFCPELLPVIKADAYGHGRLWVARILEAENVTCMGVGTIGEGIALRNGGIQTDILAMLGAFAMTDVKRAAEHNIILLIHSFETLMWACSCEYPLKIAVKFDTGMSRLGFTDKELPLVLKRIQQSPHLQPMFFISHLAAADDSAQDAITRNQGRYFFEAAAAFKAAFPMLRTSLGNSTGLLHWNELCDTHNDLPPYAGDVLRPGLILYGLDPYYGTPRAQKRGVFKPVMEVWAPIVSVRELAAGDRVSYGGTFTAPQNMRLAIVAAGYADGLHRQLSGIGELCIRGLRAPILGRICMQMTMVDVTHIPQAVVGDPAWLIGGDGIGCVSAYELASWAQTIPYEILCALGANPHEEY